MNPDNIKQPETKDPFLQRAIEHWLDSANELGYQPLFCEWLITNNYILKYSIKNTHFEQGKDVVAVSADGTPHAFQLKGGPINLKRWREEVKPEIDILIGGAIQHPDIDKSSPHISYLVTNGEIEDNVRVEIISLNEKAWKDTPLHCWTRGDLLNGFQQMAEGILPKDAVTYKKLIDLIFADGTGFPDYAKIYGFLFEILNPRDTARAKEQRKRDIAAAVLYANMIVGPYRVTKNHASTVRVMTMLLSSIFYVADKYDLEDKYWLKSYEIIWSDIQSTAILLEDEISTDGFDASFNSPLDTDLIPFRKHSAASIVYALKLAQFIKGDAAWKSVVDPAVVPKYKESILVWGEASFVPLIMLSLIFKDVPGGKVTAVSLLKSVVTQILQTNGRHVKGKGALVPPYYDIDFAVKLSFEMLEAEFDDDYKYHSYYLKSVIELLTRLNQRDFISEQWREISFMRFDELVPENPNDFLLWRTEHGENRTTLPKKENSWAEMEKEAVSLKGESLPSTLRRFPEFIPFFVTVFPFRLNSELLGYLYLASKK
ncbi:MAG: hypothetical protein RL538_623 [Candidatus Parcubacteria bacterium]|jgi:hypothetical protein